VDVRVKVGQQVIVRRRYEKAGPDPRADFADVERQDFRECPVQDGTKFVRHDAARCLGLRKRERQPVAVPLTVGQFGRRA
jgi:hypothetical protein